MFEAAACVHNVLPVASRRELRFIYESKFQVNLEIHFWNETYFFCLRGALQTTKIDCKVAHILFLKSYLQKIIALSLLWGCAQWKIRRDAFCDKEIRSTCHSKCEMS